jgi:negative regulator of flagellin synthesis FlgM
MKITHNKVGQNLNTNDSVKSERAGKSEKSAAASGLTDITNGSTKKVDTDFGATKVELSSRAQDMKKAKEVATATPDINEEKVARLQKLIDQGKYKVDAKDIADKMVDEHVSWE